MITQHENAINAHRKEIQELRTRIDSLHSTPTPTPSASGAPAVDSAYPTVPNGYHYIPHLVQSGEKGEIRDQTGNPISWDNLSATEIQDICSNQLPIACKGYSTEKDWYNSFTPNMMGNNQTNYTTHSSPSSGMFVKDKDTYLDLCSKLGGTSKDNVCHANYQNAQDYKNVWDSFRGVDSP